MSNRAKEAMGNDKLTVFADRGYFSGRETLACEQAGITTYVPKPYASGANAAGRFGKNDFTYKPDSNVYRCLAGEELTYRFTNIEKSQTLHAYWTTNCETCELKPHCTTGKFRRIKRWQHEGVIDDMLRRLDDLPEAMTIRRRTVEHPFGILKSWMGPCHLLTKGLEKVRIEIGLSVLAYNLKRMITMMGVKPLIAAIKTN